MSNFHPLVVVGRASETQLQVGENCNSLTWRFGGYDGMICSLFLTHDVLKSFL